MAFQEQFNSDLLGPLAPPRRESKVEDTKLTIQNFKSNVFTIPSRKPSLSIVTKVQITVNKSDEKAQTAPLPQSPSIPTSPSMNPLQRLANLASLFVFVIWRDIPLLDWNKSGNRYYEFRSNCERMLAATRLSPSVVVVGLKYMERVKALISIERNKGAYDETIFADEGVIWAACLLLSHKYLDDKHYSNPVFAGVNKISTSNLNIAERECLRLLDFKLAILETEYSDFRKTLQGIVTDSIKSIGSPSTPTPSSPIATIITTRSPGNAAFLYPKSKRISPYQAPISPGILEPEQQLWSPDSEGGPLRPRDKKQIVLLQGISIRTAGLSAPPRTTSFSPYPDQTHDSPADTDSDGPRTSCSITDHVTTEMNDFEK
jgi:hypothetical protein